MKNMVYLIGAGPGACDLITLRGLEYIKIADCILYDRLISSELLGYAKDGCEKIYVGKAAGKHSASQDEINHILLEKAQQGGIIVRLKGGDPYVFGRGGEEALCLQAHQIPFEVVPGVSSSIAGPAFAGIPVTHRDTARSLHIITAHTSAGGLQDDDFARLAPLNGTLVFLMGLSQAASIANGLIRFGMSPHRSAAAISRAGTPQQKTIVSTLAQFGEKVSKSCLCSPALIVVSDTVDLRDKLNFFENRPLWGRRILITSDQKHNGKIISALNALGANAVPIPMFCLSPKEKALESALSNINSYTYLIFTSGNTVDYFIHELEKKEMDIRALSGLTICAVGPSTFKKLLKYGIHADLVPVDHCVKGLLQELQNRLLAKDRVLLPQSAQANPVLRDELKQICSVDAIDLYESVFTDSLAENARNTVSCEKTDGVVFTSSLAAKSFVAAAGTKVFVSGAKAFSLGASTSAALQNKNIIPIQSDDTTIESLIEKIVDVFTRGE